MAYLISTCLMLATILLPARVLAARYCQIHRTEDGEIMWVVPVLMLLRELQSLLRLPQPYRRSSLRTHLRGAAPRRAASGFRPASSASLRAAGSPRSRFPLAHPALADGQG